MENVLGTHRPRKIGERQPGVLETILQVIAEAIESASAARSRYPLAD
jgi:hypothetical protein